SLRSDSEETYCGKMDRLSLSFVLFTAANRVTLREEDMMVENISKIFQVSSQSLYLTDYANVVVFPRADGHFSSLELIRPQRPQRPHYGCFHTWVLFKRTKPRPPEVVQEVDQAKKEPVLFMFALSLFPREDSDPLLVHFS
ncbi:hypothetical protein M9458_052392, partial [Cirrhinus mrigala]